MKRYRICHRCGHRWNVSRQDPGPQRYLRPACANKKRRSRVVKTRKRQNK